MKTKFRAFYNGRFYYSDNNEGECFFSLDSDGVVFEIVSNDGHIDIAKDAKIDQFTGIQDKHGVDIYEGDIVEHRSDLSSASDVKYFEGAFIAGAAITLNALINFNCPKNVSVIGNTHEDK